MGTHLAQHNVLIDILKNVLSECNGQGKYTQTYEMDVLHMNIIEITVMSKA